jgi:hypothetical protein
MFPVNFNSNAFIGIKPAYDGHCHLGGVMVRVLATGQKVDRFKRG